MQKATVFNMPVACAAALTYGDYTTLPQAGNVIFFWWTPDPTFLDLSPMVLKFAPTKAAEWNQGNMLSEGASAPINTISSRDLHTLAPILERFADNVDLPMSEMDNMLKDHLDKGLDYSEESWRNVTCTWLRNNRALWQKWIPDESECSGGFGLYDAVLNQFTNDRNVSNKIICQAAWFSRNFQQRSPRMTCVSSWEWFKPFVKYARIFWSRSWVFSVSPRSSDSEPPPTSPFF